MVAFMLTASLVSPGRLKLSYSKLCLLPGDILVLTTDDTVDISSLSWSREVSEGFEEILSQTNLKLSANHSGSYFCESKNSRLESDRCQVVIASPIAYVLEYNYSSNSNGQYKAVDIDDVIHVPVGDQLDFRLTLNTEGSCGQFNGRLRSEDALLAGVEFEADLQGRMKASMSSASFRCCGRFVCEITETVVSVDLRRVTTTGSLPFNVQVDCYKGCTAADKVALLIGLKNYVDEENDANSSAPSKRLRYCKDDVGFLEKVLTKAGFHCFCYADLTTDQLVDCVEKFSGWMPAGAYLVVYVAAHGCQVKLSNAMNSTAHDGGSQWTHFHHSMGENDRTGPFSCVDVVFATDSVQAPTSSRGFPIIRGVSTRWIEWRLQTSANPPTMMWLFFDHCRFLASCEGLSRVLVTKNPNEAVSIRENLHNCVVWYSTSPGRVACEPENGSDRTLTASFDEKRFGIGCFMNSLLANIAPCSRDDGLLLIGDQPRLCCAHEFCLDVAIDDHVLEICKRLQVPQVEISKYFRFGINSRRTFWDPVRDEARRIPLDELKPYTRVIPFEKRDNLRLCQLLTGIQASSLQLYSVGDIPSSYCLKVTVLPSVFRNETFLKFSISQYNQSEETAGPEQQYNPISEVPLSTYLVVSSQLFNSDFVFCCCFFVNMKPPCTVLSMFHFRANGTYNCQPRYLQLSPTSVSLRSNPTEPFDTKVMLLKNLQCVESCHCETVVNRRALNVSISLSISYYQEQLDQLTDRFSFQVLLPPFHSFPG